jgi:asparagine synthase (glutamine-hydrolysing)
VKVALGGDGGDELFGGYDRYYGNVYASWYALLPEWFRRQLVSRALKLVPEGYWYRSVSHQLRWLNQMSFYSAGERYGNSLSYFYFSPQWRDAVFAPKLVQEAAGFDPVRNLAEFFDAPNASELIDRMLYTDSMTRMPDHPVMILDRMSMAHGLEARSPFLDHELAEFCARMPPRFKVRRTRRRYIQVELARRYLPEKLLNREKQGFASPLVYLLDAEFKHLYGTLLRDSQLVAAGYLQADGVNALLEAHLGRRADHGQRLWQLCNAEIWYRMYIGGEERDAMRERIQAAA